MHKNSFSSYLYLRFIRKTILLESKWPVFVQPSALRSAGGRTQARKQNHVTRKLERIALLNLSDCSLTTYKKHLLDSTLFLRVECKSVSINALRDRTICHTVNLVLPWTSRFV